MLGWVEMHSWSVGVGQDTFLDFGVGQNGALVRVKRPCRHVKVSQDASLEC